MSSGCLDGTQMTPDSNDMFVKPNYSNLETSSLSQKEFDNVKLEMLSLPVNDMLIVAPELQSLIQSYIDKGYSFLNAVVEALGEYNARPK